MSRNAKAAARELIGLGNKVLMGQPWTIEEADEAAVLVRRITAESILILWQAADANMAELRREAGCHGEDCACREKRP
jgi:hypothetical protein